jgi:DNA-binding transcriptional MerR regulator
MPYLKIGQLAGKVGCLPSTIHFYTQEGLIKESKRTRGGYRLYDEIETVKRIKKIINLQTAKRLTIQEIKESFLH